MIFLLCWPESSALIMIRCIVAMQQKWCFNCMRNISEFSLMFKKNPIKKILEETKDVSIDVEPLGATISEEKENFNYVAKTGDYVVQVHVIEVRGLKGK